VQKTQKEVLPTVDGARQEATSLHFLRLMGDRLTYANVCLLFGHLGPHRAVTRATQARREKGECRVQNAEWPSKPTQGSSLALPGPQSRRLRATAGQRSAPQLNRSTAEMPQESGLDKLG
jgi:hypothetical protein